VSDYFDELVGCLTESKTAVDAPYFHGLLTGFATVPEARLGKLWPEISGGHALAKSLQAAVNVVLVILADELSASEFQARFRTDRDDEPERWINGYLKAVALHEAQWEEANELHPEAATALILLHTLVDTELRRDLRIGQPGRDELRQDPELVSQLVVSIYRYFHSDADDDLDLFADEIPLLPGYSSEALAEMDENALFALVIGNDDRLPLEVVYECAGRAEAMVPLLRQHLERDANWRDDVSKGDWWGLVHAIFILGLIAGEASAQTLLEGFRRITIDSDNDLADWFSSYWPALCANKTEYTTSPMLRIAEDCDLYWYPRVCATECVIADATDSSPARGEEALDWLAALCADETQDQEFRFMAANCLLDFPTDRHRPLLEDLAALQEGDFWTGRHFDRQDIDRAFVTYERDAEWVRFANPWQFYEVDEIQRRQDRWLKEAREEEAELFGLDDREPTGTYVREQPKVGRNAPCPCGSGRKYKQCCGKH